MKDYIQQAIQTEAPISDELLERLQLAARLLHAQMGMTTEVGEFTDQLKKHIFYGKPLDHVNLEEEIGDLFWYIALALDACKVSNWDQLLQRNINKLRTRYPDKFKEYDALNRNLEAERKELEDPICSLCEQPRSEHYKNLLGGDELFCFYQRNNFQKFKLKTPKPTEASAPIDNAISNLMLPKWKVDISKLPLEYGAIIGVMIVTAPSEDAAKHKAIIELLKNRTFDKPNEDFPRTYQLAKKSISVKKVIINVEEGMSASKADDRSIS
jgi:NTP pyrophosphatase (non-canonical NTP hydrolase)